MRAKHLILLLIAGLMLLPVKLRASQQEIDVPEILFEHLLDSYEWHITKIGSKDIVVWLPVIVIDSEGLKIFSSKRFHEHSEYRGLHIAPAGQPYEGKIVKADGRRPFDISITKNVLSLMFSAVLLLLIILSTARWYKKHDAANEAPRGIAAFVEPLVMMVHDIAKENIGEDYRRFSPYLCMVFFFILLNNFLGIIPFFPAGANLTGNIAVTLVLALFTFFTVNLFGTKEYYKEIFSPEVPVFLKPIMPVVEIFSAIMKPLSLTIRLFANMMAGHILALCLVCLIFFLAKYSAVIFGSITAATVLLGIFADLLECLVAFVQAYVFTILSSIYIGAARHKVQ